MTEDESKDPTHLVAIYLALAFQQVRKIQEDGVDLSPGGRDILINHLERAWRDNLFIRMQFAPGELDFSLLTKFGAVSDAATNPVIEGTPGDRDTESTDNNPTGDGHRSNKARYRRRRVVQPRGSKRDGGSGVSW
ncbi:hypothetical protein KAR91_24870 [Candidatus Pacearchaeota archaeon]|nr:hypothetical protein [Candidatus Pacearchaeota archaeon]